MAAFPVGCYDLHGDIRPWVVSVWSFRWIGRAAEVVAVIAVVGGVSWRFATLEGRVSNLEDRVHTLTDNPLAQACVDFARELANLTPGDMFDEQRIKALRSAMEGMGCGAPKK
jgi:hypothetical protein